MDFQSYSTYQAPPQEAPQDFVQVHVRDTTTRVSSSDGVVTEDTTTVERGGTMGLNPYHGTQHFGSTAKNPSGVPVTELLPTTVVTIEGVEAPISFWVREGRVTKGADGTYSEAEGTPQAPPSDIIGDHLPMPDAAMAQVNAALESVDQGCLDAIAAVGTGVAIGRMDRSALVQRFQQASGKDYEEAVAHVNVIMTAYQEQADRALKSRSGIAAADLPAFWAWAKQHRQGPLQEAVQRQIHAHDVSGYKALATQWAASTAPSLAALKASGVPVRKNGGKDEAYIRGQWMSPGAAARAGLF